MFPLTNINEQCMKNICIVHCIFRCQHVKNIFTFFSIFHIIIKNAYLTLERVDAEIIIVDFTTEFAYSSSSLS